MTVTDDATRLRREAGRWRGGELSVLGLVLAVFAAVMLTSVEEKSLTFDELGHTTAGFVGWKFSDNRLAPEAGLLSHRLASLPLFLGEFPFPPLEDPGWRAPDSWGHGHRWFYLSGNDAARMARLGRAACAVSALVLAGLVWLWSRRLFGKTAGWISLGLFVLSPGVLANGPLMTSDMTASLFFFACTGAIWRLAQRVTVGRMMVCALTTAGLFLTKMSAGLMLPIALGIAVVRIVDGRPLAIAIGRGWALIRRSQQALAMAGIIAIQAVLVVALIWAAYGFRYSASATEGREARFQFPWEHMLKAPDPLTMLWSLELSPTQLARAKELLEEHGVTAPVWREPTPTAMEAIRAEVLTADQQVRFDKLRRVTLGGPALGLLAFAREHRLLPEAWIYGAVYVLRAAEARHAFWNGEWGQRGWNGFFPYVFAVKTPLAIFVVVGVAGAVAVRRVRAARKAGRRTEVWKMAYATFPLWILPGVYWAAALASHLNIGHRHLLPVYAPLFVLAGAAAGGLGRAGRGLVVGALVVLAAEVAAWFPNYLAYFNGIVSPTRAHRHLVDSSLDWGQELPAVARYIAAHPEGGPFYFSYFGTANPGYHRVRARPLPSFMGLHLDGEQAPVVSLQFPAERAEQMIESMLNVRDDYDVPVKRESGAEIVAVMAKKPGALRWGAGTYLISATMLQSMYPGEEALFGPWAEPQERTYRELRAAVLPLTGGDEAAREEALKSRSAEEWSALLTRFDRYRFARLAAFLREREPSDAINYSVLVYRLSEADLARALE